MRFLHSRWQALVFALLSSAISLTAYWSHLPLLENLDQRSRDVVFRWRVPPSPPEELAIIAVDEASIKTYGRWPWAREVQADLITRLKQYEAGVIALDIVYAQPTNATCNCADQDAILQAALAEPGSPVVGGYFFRNDRTGDNASENLGVLAENRIRQKLLKPGSRLDMIPVWAEVETVQAEFASQMAGLGFFNRNTDIDGLVRSVPLLMRFGEEIFPSLALRALSVYYDMAAGLTADDTGVTNVRLGGVPIPVDEQGRIAANFYAKDNGIPIYSAADLMAGVIDPDLLFDRLVFVGVTEIGIGDLVPTPVDGQFPGVAMHATVAGNIIQENFLFSNLDTVLIDIALIALIPLLSIMLMAYMRKLSQMLAALVFFSGLLGVAFYYLVAHKAQLVSLIYPGLALAIAFSAFQVYYILTSQRTTKFLTGAFSSYVSPDVVDQLLLAPDSLGLSGEERELSVLFSDIRGFTSISEVLSPQLLVDMLNEFFDEMTSIVMANNGTLDKFIGDAIMALFNAPLNIPDHQAHAARTALAMIARLNELRPKFIQTYDADIHIGVGLHCGKAVVGNLGSTRRFDYTAIGDAVNLASRIESITKYYGVPIILTADLMQHLDQSFLCRPLDRIRVKGKTEPAEIYQLMDGADANRELAHRFGEALGCYFAGDFSQAREQLQSLLIDFEEDKPTQIMHARCLEFLDNPPAGDWDGVYQAESK